MNELGTCVICDLKHVDVMLNDDETDSYECKSINGHSGAVSDEVMSSDERMKCLALTINLNISCSVDPPSLEYINQ